MEEAKEAQKKLVQVEADFEAAKKRLQEAIKNLEGTENALNKVRIDIDPKVYCTNSENM